MTDQNLAGWRFDTETPDSLLPLYEQAVENLGGALDVAEGSKPGYWKLSAFFDAADDKAHIIAGLAVVAKITGQNMDVTLSDVPHVDWQAKALADFPPFAIGRFFVHGYDVAVPAGLVGLKVPAAMAFGSGEHATTEGCLRLYETLTAERTFKNGLDMGAGSGILALAAAKVQKTPFLAVDIDEPSVRICDENMHDNGVAKTVTSVCGDGFDAPEVATRAPYDLIFANILKNPLIAMAEDLVAVLAGGGVCILSGFTDDQEADVTATYTALGLTVQHAERLRGWVALALKKN
ncbi:MAG: methyltransferase domain-containing protein [Proteobacteria bacterium]|nr:methyltransferase domain-containing protein [Pseudomonadota bacterium]